MKRIYKVSYVEVDTRFDLAPQVDSLLVWASDEQSAIDYARSILGEDERYILDYFRAETVIIYGSPID